MTTQQLNTINAILQDSRYEHLAATALTALIANAVGATYNEVEKFLCHIKK